MEKITPKTSCKFYTLKNDLINEILSFIALEDFSNKKFPSKKFLSFFLENHKLIILNYILNQNPKKNKNLTLHNFHIYYLSSITYLKYNFKELIKKFILKYFLTFFAYKNEGGIYNNKIHYHYQNIFSSSTYEGFRSSLTGNPFNIFATIFKKKEENNYLNKVFSEEVKDINNKLYLHMMKDNIDKVNNTSLIIKPKEFTFDEDYLLENSEEIEFNNYIQDVYKNIITGELNDDKNIVFPYIKYEQNLKTFFYLDAFYVDNKGGYACPIKTFVIYIHDVCELNQDDLALLSNVFQTEEDLNNFIDKENYFLKEKNLEKFSVIKKEIREENKIMFYELDTMNQRFFGMNLKLLGWVRIPDNTQEVFSLSKLKHFGKHLILKLINQNNSCEINWNIDFKTLNFFGGLLKIETEEN